MTVVHALGWYLPDHVGGSEVYVEGLVRELRRLGIESCVTAPASGEELEEHLHDGVPVFRYPIGLTHRPEPVDEDAQAQSFQKLLKRTRAAVYHQHSWTSGCGIVQLRAARRAGLRTVLTVHTATPLCLRATLMLFGKEPCDGRLESVRCGSCWGSSRGMPRPLSAAVARFPLSWSQAARRLPPSKLATAASWRADTEAHIRRLKELEQLSDRIVVLSEWFKEALILNGVEPAKLLLCRQAIEADASASAPDAGEASGGDRRQPLRICFLGRWDRIKGIETLVSAVLSLPREVSVQLSVHAVGEHPPEQLYRRQIESLAAGDQRVRFPGPLPRHEVIPTLARADLLALPSQNLEMAPLVVLEAHAAGTPVIGSDLGGIREMVRHGEDGWLVPVGRSDEWARALAQLARDRQLLARLKRGVPPVRRMAEVAAEMAELYADLLRGHRGADFQSAPAP